MGLFEQLYKHACSNPDNIAIEDDAQKITYKQLYNLICNNRKHLIDNGICKCIVAYKVTNQLDFLLNILSLFAVECWVIPIPPDVKHNTLDIDCNVKCINSTLFVRDYKTNYDTLDIDENLCGIYHMTSGSTGVMKYCKRSLASLLIEGEAYMNLFSSYSGRILSMAPIYHSFALGAAVFPTLISLGNLRTIDRFIPRKVVSIIADWKANIIIGVPVMISAIALVSISSIYKFDSLYVILSGTGNVTRDVQEKVKKRFGVSVSINYGSTETGGILSRLGEEPYESVGKEMSGVEIRIVKNDGSVAEVNEEGEAYVRCPYMMSGYADDSETFYDGYFPMGDVIKKDSDGFYYVVGRKKNIINIGGKKVSPLVVQNALLSCPGVRDCYVKKGIRNNNEYIHALVVGDKLNEISIRKHLSGQLCQYQMPSVIQFVSKIERNEVGKYLEKEQREENNDK